MVLLLNGMLSIFLSTLPRTLKVSLSGYLLSGDVFEGLARDENLIMIIDLLCVVTLNAGIMRLIASIYCETTAGIILSILSYVLEICIFGYIFITSAKNSKDILPLVFLPMITMCFIVIYSSRNKQKGTGNASKEKDN